MKTRYCGVLLLLLLALVAGAAADEGVPLFPQEFRGTVTIGGSPAPAGTVITALIDGERGGSVTTTVAGRYGSSDSFEGANLIVSGNEDQTGHTVVFLIDGQEAGQTASFTPGITTQLGLTVAGSSSGSHSSSGVSSSSDGTTTAVTTARSTTTTTSPGTTTAVTTARSTTTTTSPGTAVLATSPSGKVLAAATFRAAGGLASLTVPAGTTALDENGQPLDGVAIKIVDSASLPGVQTGTALGPAVDCGPSGASFNPSVTLVFTLSENEWSEIGDQNAIRVVRYDTGAGSWQEVPATVDAATRTITAQVSHFSIYALAWESVQKEVTASTAQETPATTAAPEAAEPTGETPPWLFIGAAAIILIGAVIGGAFYIRKKN